MVLFVECVFSEGFYIALGEVFYDNRGFLLVQYSVEAAFEQILIVEIELIAHSFAEIVVVHFPLYQRKKNIKSFSLSKKAFFKLREITIFEVAATLKLPTRL